MNKDGLAVLTLNGRYYRQYPPGDPMGHATEMIELAREETAFLLVDVYGRQHGDEDPSTLGLPSFYLPGPGDNKGQIIREKIVPAKAAAKAAGLRVAYLTNYLSPGLSSGTEWRNMSMRTCGVDVLTAWQPPTPILEHIDVIAPGSDEPLVEKQYYSGFHETHLDSLLRGWGVHNLITVGFDTRVCLGATVVDAMYRNYRVVVLRDAVATSEFPETEKDGLANLMAIRFIECNVGYTVTTQEFIDACNRLTGHVGGEAPDLYGADA